MISALEYIKDKERMCKKYTNCRQCPFLKTEGYTYCNRNYLENNHPEKAIEIVENWAKENSVKTYKDVFLEMHPKAEIFSTSSAHANICKKYVFGGVCTLCVGEMNCNKCWNQPYEQEDNK